MVSASAVAEQIEIRDVGAIKVLPINFPPGGGAVVLRGRNGTGKSTALRAVDRLATDNKKIGLQPRDGTDRGSVTGFGRRLRIGAAVTSTGELEVESLEGRISVADLVDPRMKGEEEADAKRIRALARLAGIVADPTKFHSLVGGEAAFNRMTAAADLKTDDVLELTDRVKRAIEAECRSVSGMAALERQKALTCKQSSDSVDTSAESDEDTLRARHGEALRLKHTLEARMDEYQRQKSTIDKANESIAQLRASYNGPTSEQAHQAVLKHRELSVEAELLVASLRERLQQAQSQLELRKAEESAANQELRSAQSYEAGIRAWSDSLKEITTVTEPPKAEELEAAKSAEQQAAEALQHGAVVRRAIAELAESRRHTELAEQHEKNAETLRNAAQSVDSVLSDQLAKLEGCPLKIEAGRLVTQTRRGTTKYAELSEGERWRIALDIAIPQVGSPGLLQVPQDAWEGLDPVNQRAIDEQLKGRGVWVITAKATDDEEVIAASV